MLASATWVAVVVAVVRRGVVEAAACLAQHSANLADTGTGLQSDEFDNRAAPGWGLVPSMTATFLRRHSPD